MKSKFYACIPGIFTLLIFILLIMQGCKSPQDILIEQSLQKTHEAVTPTTQKAKWAESWWMPRHEAILEKNKNEETDLIFIGNSIIHGWENAGKETWDNYFSQYNPVNMGFGGDQTQHVLWRLDNGELDNINPKLAVVMIGTNNAGNGHSSEMIADGVIQIISRIRTKLPKTKILLLRIFPRGNPGAEIRETNTKASEIFSAVADNKKVIYMDINEIFLDQNDSIPFHIMRDKLHPTTEGYVLWVDVITDKVSELIK